MVMQTSKFSICTINPTFVKRVAAYLMMHNIAILVGKVCCLVNVSREPAFSRASKTLKFLVTWNNREKTWAVTFVMDRWMAVLLLFELI